MLTNQITGKSYIGLSVCIRDRLKSHFNMRDRSTSIIHKSIAKYGASNFTVEVLHLVGKEKLNELEIAEIAERGTLAPNGYNLCLGGGGTSGYRRSEQSKLDQSVRSKGVPKPEGFGEQIAESNRKRWESAEARESHRQKFLGREISQSTREKIRAARLGTISPKRQSIRVSMHGILQNFTCIEDAAEFLTCSSAAVISYAKKGTPLRLWENIDGKLVRVALRFRLKQVLDATAIVYT